MRNLKHSIVAIIAVAMISAMGTAQITHEARLNEERISRITTSAAADTLTIAEKKADEGTALVFETIDDDQDNTEPAATDIPTDNEDAEEEIAKKSFFQIAYAKLAEGTLAVYETPSDEALVIDRIEKLTEVEIMESTEGWYKIAYGDEGRTGYVVSAFITSEKDEAQEAAMNYTHYRKARIDINGDSVRVRASASTDSDIITELSDNTKVIDLGGEGEFIHIAYGDDYAEGYVTNSAIILEDDWISKTDVSDRQAEAKREKEAEAARARQASSTSSSSSSSSSDKSSGSSASPSTSDSSNSSASSSSSSKSKGQALVDTAKKYMGVKYVWGGTSPSGFDCSGLVQYVCRQNGISVNRTSREQIKNGVAVSKSDLQPGDLVFFARNGVIHHVGIYVGNGNMIHAPQTGDVVKISSIETSYRQKQYAGARRVV